MWFDFNMLQTNLNRMTYIKTKTHITFFPSMMTHLSYYRSVVSVLYLTISCKISRMRATKFFQLMNIFALKCDQGHAFYSITMSLIWWWSELAIKVTWLCNKMSLSPEAELERSCAGTDYFRSVTLRERETERWGLCSPHLPCKRTFLSCPHFEKDAVQ